MMVEVGGGKQNRNPEKKVVDGSGQIPENGITLSQPASIPTLPPTGRTRSGSDQQKEKSMTEPDWTTAPSWAQWFTIDDDGYGFWWDTQPVANKMVGCWQVDMSADWYDTQPAGIYPDAADDWEHSLRQRPAEGEEHDRA